MKSILCAIIVLSYIYVIPCTAQIGASDSLEKKVSMDEVVISANKTSESKKVVAQQVTILNQKQIEKANAQTTADLLLNTAGVFVQKSQMGGGSPVLRGFEANKVLIMIDGVRMNNLIYRGGHLQNVITVDPDMLDRLEVLYGPSSTIYGSDALGGVMNFYTKKPLFAYGGDKLRTAVNAYTRFGSVNNEMTGHADVNLGGKRFASLTSLTYSSFGDLRGGASQNPFYDSTYGERPFYAARVNGVDTLLANDDKYVQKFSGYKQYNVMQKFAFKQNEHVTHGLNLQYSTSSDIPRYDRLTDPGSGGGLKSAEWYYGPQERAMAAYNLSSVEKESFFQKKQVGVNYQRIIESRHTRRFGKDEIDHRTEKVGVLGIDVDYIHESDKHRVRIGLEQQMNTLKSVAETEHIISGATTPTDTRYPDGKNRMNTTAAYGSHTWHINEKFTLVDGLRMGTISLLANFEDTSILHLPFKEVKQDHFVYSGNVGLIHMPSDKWKLSLMVSTGFRAPNIDDLAKVFESVPGTIIVPNSDLKPEKTINTELGISKLFGDNTVWDNSFYYTRLIDAIVTAPSQFVSGEDSLIYNGVMSRVWASQNLGRAYIYGFSSNVKSQVTDYLLLSGGVTYTYGRVVTDSADAPLDHISPLLVRVQATYSKGKLGADFFVNYHGEKKLEDYYLTGEDNIQYATPVGMPAWMTANLRVSYKVHKYITLQAGIDNILDTQYRVFSSGINAPGRNLFGVVRFKLK